MNKIVLVLITIFIAATGFAQGKVGVNTTNPQEVFHVDGKKDNPATGVPTTTADDVVITGNGRIGVGVINPTTKVQINANVANKSGLSFTQMNAATPSTDNAKLLGVDAAGNVVTVDGPPTPISDRIEYGGEELTLPGATGGGTPQKVIDFTLPKKGTYLITYTCRGQILNAVTAQAYIKSYLAYTSSGIALPVSEVLVCEPGLPRGNSNPGGTGTGTYILSVNGPTGISMMAQAAEKNGAIKNSSWGRTVVSYVQIGQ